MITAPMSDCRKRFLTCRTTLFAIGFCIFCNGAISDTSTNNSTNATSFKAREIREPEAATGFTPKPAVSAKKHMAVTANPYATEAAQTMLEAGGSAVDAAIAAQLVLTLVEPQSSGIGGGTFILHWQAKTNKLSAYDGRETAPASTHPGLFLNDKGQAEQWIDAVVGGRSAGVPGVVRAMELVHKKHGKLPWKKLFKPAIQLAEEGFVVSPRLHRLVNMGFNPGLKQLSASRAYFYRRDQAIAAGTTKKNPDYAAALKLIADSGAKAFYQGRLAENMVKAINTSERNPGAISLKDFEQYQVKEKAPLCKPYRQYRICAMPPPAGGVTLLQIMALLEAYELKSYGVNQLDAIHLYTQASRLAFADREFYLADPDFIPVPVQQLLEPKYLSQRRQFISDKDMGKASAGRLPKYSYGRDNSLEMPSTSHLSIVDAQGNAVSMTSSIEMAFGSTVFVNGYLINNQLTDFSLNPVRDGRTVANQLQPGKRPRSSMTPIMVFDRQGKLVLVLGSPGGSRIINYLAHTLIAALDWGLDIQQAISLPKASNRNGSTTLEKGSGITLLEDGLKKLGHKVQIRNLNSGLHGIQIAPGESLLGGADPRREGVALGR